MRKSFVRVAGALAVVAALASAGCGRSTTTEATGGGDGERTGTVGISMPTKSSERWVADGNNMAEQFTALGYQTDLQYGDDVVQN
ncbi:MAG: sugar ABC transporter substrate-binding protein, partial [Mycolicibacterium sp.]|nr:sugar ABC transporter substrate-binding protein [Mycolicibacterium sp.]